MEIIYPAIEATSSLPQLQLKFKVNKNYLAKRIMPNYSGPPMIAINYQDMKPGNVIPYHNPDIVLASAMLASPKFSDYHSDYMDQPFVEKFDWFKDIGKKRFGLIQKIYQVVDVPGYPTSNLYLKEQEYHDFYIYCGLDAIPDQDLCILGKEIEIKEKNSGELYIVNLDIRFNKRSLSDWSNIEQRMTRYFLSRLEIMVTRGVSNG